MSFHVLSWNIDGLCEDELEVRAVTISELINTLQPDICLLQEMVDDLLDIITSLCEGYIFKVHKLCSYYNIIMVKEGPGLILNSDPVCIGYEQSKMGRFLLSQDVELHGHKFTFMTTHLESTGPARGERKRQLKLCFDTMQNIPTDRNVVLSGDMNLRDAEVASVGGLPYNVLDAWEVCNSPMNSEFTWDLEINDNKIMPGPKKPRLRFDRMYFRKAHGSTLKCKRFELIGKKRIEACGLFPSDHFGILATFRIVN